MKGQFCRLLNIGAVARNIDANRQIGSLSMHLPIWTNAPGQRSSNARLRICFGSALRVALSIAFLGSFTWPVSAGQQRTDPSSNARVEERSSAETTSALPQITVRAQREAIQKQAHQFVQKITESAFAPDDAEHVLGLLRIPLWLAPEAAATAVTRTYISWRPRSPSRF